MTALGSFRHFPKGIITSRHARRHDDPVSIPCRSMASLTKKTMEKAPVFQVDFSKQIWYNKKQSIMMEAVYEIYDYNERCRTKE